MTLIPDQFLVMNSLPDVRHVYSSIIQEEKQGYLTHEIIKNLDVVVQKNELATIVVR